MAHRNPTLPILLIALLLPTAGAFVYFVLLEASPHARTVYFLSKTVQFALPLLFVAATLAAAPRLSAGPGRAAAVGLGSGLVLGLGVGVVYAIALRGSEAEALIAEAIAVKMADFSIDRPAAYLAMSLFLSLLHSGLEEYYWRWFVFGNLRRRFETHRFGPSAAVVVSSLGFMAHHVIVIHQFLAGGPKAWLVLPVSLSVALGGVVWAVMYQRTGRLLAPWLSHVLVDVAIMALGHEMIWGFSRPLSKVSTETDRDLVLVGGGHTHVQVLRSFAMAMPERTRLTVVLDRPVAVYSGMVPGFVAGQYRAEELEIDVVPLARRAGARVVLSRATGVDPAARRIELEDRPPLAYDFASFDIGSTVAGLELPGVREHALPTRPIAELVHRTGDLEELAGRRLAARGETEESSRPFRVVVVGGGAGGVELAFAVERRLRAAEIAVAVHLVEGGPRLLAGYPVDLLQRVARQAERRGISIATGQRVRRVESDRLELESLDRDATTSEAFDLLIWVAGATSHPVFASSGLPVDARGFVKIESTLQIVGMEDLFAVGDCATLQEYPQTPKAGVYAVRQGPYLTANLRAALGGGRLRAYRPQSDFLTLLNLGDGTAVGSKWGRAFEGTWVMRLKDRIDRRFMRRFQVLDGAGRLTPEFASQPAMDSGGDDGEMLCGGCAAKVGQSALERALARVQQRSASPEGTSESGVVLGLAAGDDAAAYRTPAGDVVVTSIDAFRAFTDDPYVVGRVAAVNAAGDVQVKGVEPAYALALVSVPDSGSDVQQEETLYQVLAGARRTFDELGIELLGGHTTTAPELLVGFSIDGIARGAAQADGAAAGLLPISALEAGQHLVLTKGLGTGVLFHADMQGLVTGGWLAAALTSMTTSNGPAIPLARAAGATAATDVTGFGLAGHLSEMLEASRARATLDLTNLPALPGALELLEQGERSTSHAENARMRARMRFVGESGDDPRAELLFDPQTSGGFLIAVPAANSEELVAQLRQEGFHDAATIGEVTEPEAAGPRLTIR